jgi:hypothetical protein
VGINSRIGLVLALLFFHFYSRHAALQAIPLSLGDGSYAYVYRVSLNLVMGRGFTQSVFPETPEGNALRQFTLLNRAELSSAQLDAYYSQPYSAPVYFDSVLRTVGFPVNPSDGPYVDDHYKTRVLDIRVAALIWKLFGVSWAVYFSFYSLVSTLAALCIFLIGRKIGGYWTGLVAMLFYTACPFENEYLIRSVRDSSPLWFAAFGFAYLAYLAGAGRSQFARMMSYVGAGVVAAIGYGWRPDALILPPFMLAVVIASLMLQRRPAADILNAAGLFVLGTLLCLGGIRLLTPGGGISPEHGFHMAYYGHAERANLLGMEDTRAVFRCDIHTHLDAGYFAVANSMPDGGEPYLSPSYGAACRAMFIDEMEQDSWRMVSRFPVFIVRALRGTGLKDLPLNTDYFAPAPKWPPFLAFVRHNVLDPLYLLTPYLTIIGIIAALFQARPPIAGALVAFLLYYAAILFCVLPEYKHTGLLVLPLSVLSGLAVTSFAPSRWRQARWKSGGVTVLILVATWGAVSAIAYPYSVSRRAALIDEVRQATAGASETVGIRSPQLFVFRRDSHDHPDRIGYLLEIEAGPKPAHLISRSLRQTDVPRFYESTHNLLPGRKQFFFTTSYLGLSAGAKSLENTILLDGDARILSAKKVDLSNWKDIEVSTVFYDGERSPGSPSVDGYSNRTIYALPPLDENLLTADESLRLARLVVASGPPALAMPLRPADTPVTMSVAPELFAITPGATKKTESGVIRFTTSPAGGQGWLRSPGLTSPGGTIHLRVRYRLRKGNLAIAIFPEGGQPFVCQQAQAVQDGDSWTESVSLRRRAGEQFFFVIANGYAPLDQPTEVEISEVRLSVQ